MYVYMSVRNVSNEDLRMSKTCQMRTRNVNEDLVRSSFTSRSMAGKRVHKFVQPLDKNMVGYLFLAAHVQFPC